MSFNFIPAHMTVIISILVLGVLIFVHEFGHFLFAKLNKVGVYEFAIGFGKKIWRRQIGMTWYAVGIVPLGGYVSMAGEDPALLVQPQESSDGEKEKPVEEPDELSMYYRKAEDTWFLKKGYFSKISVVAAGPIFNYLFAILLAITSFVIYGGMEPIDDPVVGDVIPESVAEKAGLKQGDIIYSIDGQPISSWTQIAETIAHSGGKPLLLHGDHVDQSDPSKIVPFDITVSGALDPEFAVVRGENKPRYRIGISQALRATPVGFGQAVKDGTMQVWGITTMTFRGLAGMFSGTISPKHIAGPIFIFNTAAKSASKGAEHLIGFVIFLSVSLAILNLLPIPVLDGGHVLIFTIEAIIRRPLSVRVQTVATQLGLGFLLLLTLFAVSNDIRRLFS